MSKGQSILDILLIMIFLFVLVTTIVFGAKINNSFQEKFTETEGVSEVAKNIAVSNETSYLEVMDKVFLMFFITLVIGLLVAASMLNTHPVFFVLSLVLLGFLVFFGGLLSNAYEELASSEGLSGVASNFVVIPWVFGNLPKLMLGIALAVSVVLFGKSRGGGE